MNSQDSDSPDSVSSSDCLKSSQEEEHLEKNIISSAIIHKVTHTGEPPQASHGAPQAPTSQLGKRISEVLA